MDEEVTASSAPRRGERLSDREAMRWAIIEAARGAGFTSPNPNVGCVILDARGGFLASGFHQRVGGPHAEANAVAGLSSEDLVGAHVFVTLEPCAHEGRTPSCAKMLAHLPIARVVYGLVDPNPLVAGQGAQILKNAGFQVQLYRDTGDDSLDLALEESCEHFLWNFRHRSVFFSLKVASSLDGKVALADGTSRWITGPEARERGHELRATHDAILIGAGTLDHDDPSLDVRHPRFPNKRNTVIVLDSEGARACRPWKLKTTHQAGEIFWAVAPEAIGKVESLSGVTVLPVPRGANGRLDLLALQTSLWDRGLRSVLVEGGGRVAGAFLQAGLVNRLHLFQAPLLLGSEALSWNQGLQVPLMDLRLCLHQTRVQTLGRDFAISGLLKDPQSGVSFRGQ